MRIAAQLCIGGLVIVVTTIAGFAACSSSTEPTTRRITPGGAARDEPADDATASADTYGGSSANMKAGTITAQTWTSKSVDFPSALGANGLWTIDEEQYVTTDGSLYTAAPPDINGGWPGPGQSCQGGNVQLYTCPSFSFPTIPCANVGDYAQIGGTSHHWAHWTFTDGAYDATMVGDHCSGPNMTESLSPSQIPVGSTSQGRTNCVKVTQWLSGAPNIATVDANGVVTGVAEGTTYISADCYNYGAASATIQVGRTTQRDTTDQGGGSPPGPGQTCGWFVWSVSYDFGASWTPISAPFYECS